MLIIDPLTSSRYWRLSKLGDNELAMTRAPTMESRLDFEAEGRKLLDNIIKQIAEAFEDLKAVVVVTAAVDTDAQISFNPKDAKLDSWKQLENIKTKITAMASTRMELDGDVYALIPAKSNEPDIRQELLTLHKENVELATENWKKFLDGVLTVVEIGADMAGVTLPNARTRFMAAVNPRDSPQRALPK